MVRRLSTFFRRLLIIGALLLALVTTVVIVLTQTQVGRDGVARQIETAFNREFAGSLEIGSLEGNLIWTLFGNDLRVRDPDGDIVLQADSLVIYPQWRALIGGNLELRRIDLIRPMFMGVINRSGTWNVAEAFRPRRVSTREGSILSVQASEIRLVDGSATTVNHSTPPDFVQQGALFDFTNSRLTDLNARLNLEVRDGQAYVSMRSFEADLPYLDQRVNQLEGRLRLGESILSGNGITFRSGQTLVKGSFFYVDNVLNVNLESGVFTPQTTRAFVPGYFADVPVTASGRVTGLLDNLRAQNVRISSGRSDIRLDGTVDLLSADVPFSASVVLENLSGSDIYGIVGDRWPESAELDMFRGEISARGQFGHTWNIEGDVDLSTPSGLVRGIGHVGNGTGTLRYGGNFHVEYVAIQDYWRSLPNISFGGDLQVDGSGSSVETLSGTAELALDHLQFDDYIWQVADLDVEAVDGRFEGSLSLHGEEDLELLGSVNPAEEMADLRFTAARLDLHKFVDVFPETDINSNAQIRLDGFHPDQMRTDLEFNVTNSTATFADSTWALPEDRIRLIVRPEPADAPRFHLSTDALALTADGPFSWEAAVPLGIAWAERIGGTVVQSLLPRLNGEENEEHLSEPSPLANREIPNLPDQEARITLSAHRAGALRPWVEDLTPGTTLDLRLVLGADTLNVDLQGDLPSARIGTVRLEDAVATLQLSANNTPELLDSMRFTLNAQSDSLNIGSGNPFIPSLHAVYAPEYREMDMVMDVTRSSDSISVAMDAVVKLMSDRYRLLGDFQMTTQRVRWIADNVDLDLYADGLHFHHFDAERLWPEDMYIPDLRLVGIASARTTDTLYVAGNALGLKEILDLTQLDLPFDGRSYADIKVSSALGSPAIQGSATVEEFTIWGDPSGRVEAQSTIIADRDGLFDVDIHILPDDPENLINDARLVGSVRLPSRRDDGYLDLTADIRRADLFIFNHLFPDLVAESTGGGHGGGSITGDWSFPIFNADLFIDDGRTRVPTFNLDIDLTGRVTVDRQGIHLHNASVSDAGGGTGTISGGFLFNEYRFFSFDLHAELEEFEIINVSRAHARDLPFYGNIRASGSATLFGPLHDAYLRSPDAVTTPDSRIFIPIVAGGPRADSGFLVFANPDGSIPELEERRTLIDDRPSHERPFLDGLQMTLNVEAPPGSTVQLVFDPVIGEAINAVGSGQMQLIIAEGEFLTFGTFEVNQGGYQFTAGDVFTRHFDLERGGTLIWDGDPIDAQLDLQAVYRTRASLAGLDLGGIDERQRVPFIIGLDIGGRVTSPLVELSLSLDESAGRTIPASEALRRRLNEPDMQAEYATSVLLTNTFLLAPSSGNPGLAGAADELFFTSLSELVSTRINHFLNRALGAENLDVSLGVQQGVGQQEFDLTYGIALRLLDERLIIRGEGVYQQLENRPASDAFHGEVVIEARVSDNVSVELFYRRENDLLLGSGVVGAYTGAYGTGVNYQTDFTSWRRLIDRLFGIHNKDML